MVCPLDARTQRVVTVEWPSKGQKTNFCRPKKQIFAQDTGWPVVLFGTQALSTKCAWNAPNARRYSQASAVQASVRFVLSFGLTKLFLRNFWIDHGIIITHVMALQIQLYYLYLTSFIFTSLFEFLAGSSGQYLLLISDATKLFLRNFWIDHGMIITHVVALQIQPYFLFLTTSIFTSSLVFWQVRQVTASVSDNCFFVGKTSTSATLVGSWNEAAQFFDEAAIYLNEDAKISFAKTSPRVEPQI